MLDYKVTGQYALQRVKLMLVLREPQKGSALAGKLSQRDRMVLIVRYEESQLVTKA